MFRMMALVLCVTLVAAAGPERGIGSVERVSGSAALIRADRTTALGPDTALEPNDIIRTMTGGTLRLVLADGSSMILGERTELRVVSQNVDAQQTLVELLRGRVHAEVKTVTKQGGRFLLHTPTATVFALGTGFEAQTVGPRDPTGGVQITVRDNGAPIPGAEVFLVLLNAGKVPSGKTDAQGSSAIAPGLLNAGKPREGAAPAIPLVELAALGKAEMRVEVDECDNGNRQVLVLAPGAQTPPGKNCKRRRAGVFWWGHPQQVTADIGKGICESSELRTTTPTNAGAPSSLAEIPPGVVPGAASEISLSRYPGTTATIVTALDQSVAVQSGNPQLRGVTILLPGQRTTVIRDHPPGPTTGVTDKDWFDALKMMWDKGSDVASEGGFDQPLEDFSEDGKACRPIFVINGRSITGEETFRYKLTGLGTSTGNALKLQVWNDGPCSLYFLVTDGAVFHPKGFTERIVTTILFGGVPNLKDFQKMLSMGGFVRVSPARMKGTVVTTSGEAEMPLRSYCVELHKLAPHPKTEYRFGDEDDQKEYGLHQQVLDRAHLVYRLGTLKVGPSQSLDSIIQWALWTRIEKLNEKEFQQEFEKLVHKNYDAQKRKWDKAAEKQTDSSGRAMWQSIQTVLH